MEISLTGEIQYPSLFKCSSCPWVCSSFSSACLGCFLPFLLTLYESSKSYILFPYTQKSFCTSPMAHICFWRKQ